METETKTGPEFPNERKVIVEQMQGSEVKVNSKEQDCENHTQGSEQKS